VTLSVSYTVRNVSTCRSVKVMAWLRAALQALQLEQHLARGQRPAGQVGLQAFAQVPAQRRFDAGIVEIGLGLVQAIAGLAQQDPLEAPQRPGRARARR